MRPVLNIKQNPAHRLVEIMSILQGRTARARTQIEASTEHTSPFCMRMEKNAAIQVHVNVENVSNSSKSQVLSQTPNPLSSQALRPKTKSSPEESNDLYSTSNTQTPRKGCQIHGRRGIMHHFSKCEQRKQTQEKKFFQKPPWTGT